MGKEEVSPTIASALKSFLALRELFYLGTVLVLRMPAKISLTTRLPDSPSAFKAGLSLAFFLWVVLSGPATFSADLRPEEIITVLPKDAIPAILSPSFDEGKKASWLKGKDFVVGVEFGGDSRAYPVPTLSRHEIINDKVGGIPIAVTW